jgi:hypothetical protein
MRTYQIKDGDTLVVSIDNCAWETITFEAKDFQDIRAATAEELVKVLNRSAGLASFVDAPGDLVLATASGGGHTSLAIDLPQSTAAANLGLLGGKGFAQGEGLRAARLVSRAAEPFPLPLDAEMTIVVDERRRRISFEALITAGKATAAEVVQAINAKRQKIATASRDGRVMLTSPSVGARSKLEVEPGRMDQDKTDAAAILGFVGVAAFDQPHKLEPARLVCSGRRVGLQVENLTASPIELHLSTGTTMLPARGSVPLAPGEAASSQLQRFIGQGVIRLTSASSD